MTSRSADTSQLKTAGAAGFLQQSHDSAASQTSRSLQIFAAAALNAAAGLWFLVAVIGQLLFVSYVVIFYGRAAVQGNWVAWNRGMPHGYVPGDTVGNVAAGMHLLLAVVIIVGGAIQFIPQIRKRAPSFHRWNGRTYILNAFTISIVGLYMHWVRGSVGDLPQHVAATLNAVLIMLFAFLALRYAIARKFSIHRRWTLRLFMVASGVWFFRVGLSLWVFLNNGPVGFDRKTYTGPFITFWSFGQYLLPLAFLELYLRARDRAGAPVRIAMATVLIVLTVALGVGIFEVTMSKWLPRIR
jgi:hypothetical protein